MKKNNIKNLKGFCTGCGACAVSCPTQAVKVSLNKEGFFTASVDEQLCVGCGKCQTVCLRAGVSGTIRLTEGFMLSAQSEQPDTIRSCTSGGVAYELSRHAVKSGMTVAGVVYDYADNMARTVLAESEEELAAFKGSKYIQSESSVAFAQLVKKAHDNPKRKFLTFGTPCQIYGFASSLEQEKIRDRFILIDLFCHGVPSYLVWNSYLDSLHKQLGNSSLTSVVFRNKTIGWHNFVIQLTGSEGSYKESSEGDLFYHAFFDNVLFSKSCFDCPVRKESSKADIRLGDYWGKRYQDRDDGVSAVLLLTSSGEKFFRDTPYVRVLDTTSVEEVLRGQSVHTYTTIPLRDSAILELQSTGDLKNTIRNYRRRFTVKKRLKLALKEYTVHLPSGIRAGLRRIYKKL